MSEYAAKVERRILRLLVQRPEAREPMAEALRGYPWSDMAHRIVFEIVASVPQLSPDQLRQVLPTRLTNAGVPDFPWQDLFAPETLSPREAEALLRTLASNSNPI